MRPVGQVRSGSTGADAQNLQDGLIALMGGGHVPVESEGIPAETALASAVAAVTVERLRGEFGPATQQAVRLLQRRFGVGPSGEVDDGTASVVNTLLRAAGHLPEAAAGPAAPDWRVAVPPPAGAGPAAARSAGERTVTAALRFPDGARATGVTVHLRQHLTSGDVVALGSAQSDAFGFVEIPFVSALAAPSLVLQVGDGAAAREIASVTNGLQPLGDNTVLPAVVPSEAVVREPERSRLVAALRSVDASLRLADLKETDAVRQVSALASATGWDGRLVALASASAQLAERVDLGLGEANQDVLYAAARAGLPADLEQLVKVHPDSFAAAVSASRDAGVVTLNDGQVEVARRRFIELAIDTLRRQPAGGTRSSFDEFLTSPMLGDLATNPGEQRVVLGELFHGDASSSLMDRLGNQLPAESLQRLAHQGRLAFASGFSVPVMNKMFDLGVDRPGEPIGSQLISARFHTADGWRDATLLAAGVTEAELLGSPAARDRLRAVLPIDYAQVDVAVALDVYANVGAQLVRDSHQHLVLAEDIRSGIPALVAVGLDRQDLEKTAELLARFGESGRAMKLTPRELIWQVELLGENVSDGVKTTVERIHRVYQISPSNESMLQLLELGVTSAYDVARLTWKQFKALYGEKLADVADAELLYNRAQQVTAVTSTLFGSYSSVQFDPKVFALSGSAKTISAQTTEIDGTAESHYPTLRQLFGSQDYCACDQCQSVIGPAAYFVDLLQFIDIDPPAWDLFVAQWNARHGADDYAGSGRLSPYEALMARRPDLAHIPLTCENTNTQLPYIDLVVEILEFLTAEGQLSPTAARDTDVDDPAELLVEPQHVIDKAYEVLAGKLYPIALPYDQPFDTARTFMSLLRTDLAATVAAVAGDTVDPSQLSSIVNGGHAALDALALPPGQFQLLTEPALTTVTWKTLFDRPNAGTDNSHVDALSQCALLADRLSVSYVELVELIRTRFVNPALNDVRLVEQLGLNVAEAQMVLANAAAYDVVAAGGTPAVSAAVLETLRLAHERISELDSRFSALKFDARAELARLAATNAFRKVVLIQDESVSCDFSNAKLVNGVGGPVTKDVLIRLQVLVRLWRRTGWSLADLDACLSTLVPSAFQDFDELRRRSALVLAGQVAQLRAVPQLSSLSLPQLLVFWSDIDVSRRDGLYGRLFLKPRVIAADPVFSDPLGRFLSKEAIDGQLASRVFSAALAADEAQQLDVAAVRDLPGVADVRFDRVFAIQHLSVVGLDAAKTAALKLAAQGQPWEATLDGLLVDLSRQLVAFRRVGGHVTALQMALGLSADDIEAICSQELGLVADAVELDVAAVSMLLRYRLLSKACSLSVAELVVFRRMLAGAFPHTDAEGAVGSSCDPFQPLTGGPIAADALTPPAQTARFVRLIGVVAEAGLDAATFAYLLWGEGADRFEEGFADQVAAFVAGVRAAKSQSPIPAVADTAVLADLLSSAFALDAPLARLLLSWQLPPAGAVVADVFDLPAGQDPDAEFLTAARAARKLALLAGQLGLNVRQCELFEAAGELFGASTLMGVLVPGPGDLARRAEFLVAVAEFCVLRDRPPAGVESVVRMVSASLNDDDAAVASELAAVAGVPVSTAAGLLTDIDRFRSAGRPRDLSWWRWVTDALAALSLSRSTRAPLSRLAAWPGLLVPATAAATSAELSREVVAAARARVGESAWAGAARPLFDRLRRSQRDALLAHCLRERGLVRAEQLYEELLLDPLTEPAVLTSRLRLAIGSVQLFIQRVLLNMEATVPPSAINGSQWPWMRHYSMWAGNRKLFIHPEDYLEPEFLDDKSDLFVELESTLLQSDVTAQVADQAMGVYLSKLAGRAKLEVQATHVERNAFGQVVLHVVARTPHAPFSWFYRRYANRLWSSWRPITAEVTGDHVAPVVWQDRLFLFWLSFIDTPDDGADLPPSGLKSLAEENPASLRGPLMGAHTTAQRWTTEVHLHWSTFDDGEWSAPTTFIPPGGDGAALPLKGLTRNERVALSSAMLATEIVPTVVPAGTDAEDVPRNDTLKVFLLKADPAVVFELIGHSSTPTVTTDSTAKAAANAGPLKDLTARRRGFVTAAKESAVSIEVTSQEVSGSKRASSHAPEVIVSRGKHGALTVIVPNQMLRGDGVASEALLRPLFIEDGPTTMFLEPTIVEHTIEQWQEWVIRTTTTPVTVETEGGGRKPVWTFEPISFEPLPVELLPQKPPIPDPWEELDGRWPVVLPTFGPKTTDVFEKFAGRFDPVINKATVVRFGEKLIGPAGGLRLDRARVADLPALTEGKVPFVITGLGGVEDQVLVVRDVGIKFSGEVFVHGIGGLQGSLGGGLVGGGPFGGGPFSRDVNVGGLR